MHQIPSLYSGFDDILRVERKKCQLQKALLISSDFELLGGSTQGEDGSPGNDTGQPATEQDFGSSGGVAVVVVGEGVFA